MKGLERTDLYDLVIPHVLEKTMSIEFDRNYNINQVVAVAMDISDIDAKEFVRLYEEYEFWCKGKKGNFYLYKSIIYGHWLLRTQYRLIVGQDEHEFLPVKARKIYSSIKTHTKSFLEGEISLTETAQDDGNIYF